MGHTDRSALFADEDFHVAFIVHRIEHGLNDGADPAEVAALLEAFAQTWLSEEAK